MNWQPIETAPKFDRILACSNKQHDNFCVIGFGICNEDGSDLYWIHDGGGIINPTHWMPLPAPPGEQQ